MFGNPDLVGITGLNNVDSVGGYLNIKSNWALTSIAGLFNLKSVESGMLLFYNSILPNLSGLESLTYLGGQMTLYNNTKLNSLEALSGLTSINGIMQIVGSDSLVSLSGLDSIAYIAEGLSINNNLSLESFSGLSSLFEIDGYFSVWENPSLMNFTGLDSLQYVNGDISITSHEILTSLTGLDNIEPNSIVDIEIYNNSLLTDCDVQSICSYLAAPGGEVSIFNNAQGCDEPEQVIEACLTGTDELVSIENKIQIFPNPADRKITITCNSSLEEVVIYSHTGLVVLEELSPENIYDISNLQPGLYFIEIVIQKEKFRKKLLIR